MKLVSLASLCGTFKNTVNPQNQIEKEFIHYSIPAFDNGLPVNG